MANIITRENKKGKQQKYAEVKAKGLEAYLNSGLSLQEINLAEPERIADFEIEL